MDKRTFLGMGALALLALVTGCGERPVADTGPPAAPAAPTEGTPAATPAEKQMVNCPRCGAENEVKRGADGRPVEITCWRCGHRWTPQV